MITLLLIDHATDRERSVSELLAASPSNNFETDRVVSHRKILSGLRGRAHDVCLIDSGFANGLKLFAEARGLGWTAPIVLATGNDAGEVLEAIRCGVADCLVRDGLDAPSIERAICAVVEQARSVRLQVERERRYLALLDNANVIIYTHDLDGKLTSMNRAGERLIGYSQQEIIGSHISELVEPRQRDRVRRMIERTLDAQVQVVERIEFKTKEGHNFTVAMGVHPIYKEGKATEIQGMVSTQNGLSTLGPREARNLLESGSGPETRARSNSGSLIYNSYKPGTPRLQTEN